MADVQEVGARQSRTLTVRARREVARVVVVVDVVKAEQAIDHALIELTMSVVGAPAVHVEEELPVVVGQPMTEQFLEYLDLGFGHLGTASFH